MKTGKDVEEINLKQVRLKMLDESSYNLSHRNYPLADAYLNNFKSSIDKSSIAFQKISTKEKELVKKIDLWREMRDVEIKKELMGRPKRWLAQDRTEPYYARWYVKQRNDFFWKIALEYDLISKE